MSKIDETPSTLVEADTRILDRKLSPNVETKLLRRASRDRPWSTTRGRKNNDFRSNSRASPHMPSRFLQEGFQKRQHEDCRECASARECNLNHVGVFSMERAKLNLLPRVVLKEVDAIIQGSIAISR